MDLMQDAVSESVEAFGPIDKASVCLKTAIPSLGWEKPLDFLNTQIGAPQVEDIFAVLQLRKRRDSCDGESQPTTPSTAAATASRSA